MRSIRQISSLFFTLTVLVITGCSNPDIPPTGQENIDALTREISSLGSNIDPDEARRAAIIAYEYPRQLALQYNVTDLPLIHNAKVNAGLRQRGLCYQWADDLEMRLRREDFKTLHLHRAIANADTILIDHSTVIIAQVGESFKQGIVLDPWRNGGRLFWSKTLQDSRYAWVARQDVFAERAAQRAGR